MGVDLRTRAGTARRAFFSNPAGSVTPRRPEQGLLGGTSGWVTVAPARGPSGLRPFGTTVPAWSANLLPPGVCRNADGSEIELVDVLLREHERLAQDDVRPL